jgi:LPS export ABC transporter permease LptG
MRLLDRYLLRELLVPFGYILTGFLIFWISFDLFSELSDYQKLRLEAGDVAEFYVVKVPEFLVLVLPIAFLLSMLYTLTNHARHNEITAMRAAGVSVARLSLPYLAVGFLLSLGLFAMNELWVPQSVEAGEQILTRRQANRPTDAQKQWEHKLGFTTTSASGTRQWLIESYNVVTFEMVRPHVEWTLPDRTRKSIFADRGVWLEGTWVFTNVHLFVHTGEPGDTPSRQDLELLPAPEFCETPEQIESEIKMGKINSFKAVRRAQLSVREILDYRRLHPAETARDNMLDTKLHGRLAAPWTCLVVVVMALPFGLGSSRRNVVVGVASSIVICFVYYVLGQLALALGAGGYVPGWLAAWTPNLLFGMGGLAMTLRVR